MKAFATILKLVLISRTFPFKKHPEFKIYYVLKNKNKDAEVFVFFKIWWPYCF